MKKTLIAGNWKMYKTPTEAVEFLNNLMTKKLIYDDREILVCPSFTSLYPASQVLQKTSSIKLGAQNVCCQKEGAFTGEVSAVMLKDIGVEYAICGHSERRQLFGEEDGIVNKKIKMALQFDICPILCIGETLEERNTNKTYDIIKGQLTNSLNEVSGSSKFVVAYEPVWAIGTGLSATPEQAEEVHLYIRKLLEEMFGKETAQNIRLLYGGSVKPDNVDSLMRQNNIDGVLVGGASLDVDSFARIIDYK
jgi:triosephosphate isomerase